VEVLDTCDDLKVSASQSTSDNRRVIVVRLFLCLSADKIDE